MAWGGYSNGNIPRTALVAVPGNGTVGNSTTQYLERNAAAAFLRMKADYDKVKGSGLLTLTEGYRSIEGQRAAWARYQAGGPRAAEIGTSIHGWGLAADFGYPITSTGTIGHNWLKANAPKYGWVWTGVNFGEAWHFEYKGATASTGSAAGGASAVILQGQKNLNFLGYNTGNPDGLDGSNTKKGTLAYQKAKGLNPDSILGNDTLNKSKEDVKAIQTMLKKLGFYKGEIDGLVGSGTIDALKAFQKSKNLTADGICGPISLASLKTATTVTEYVVTNVRQLQRDLRLLGYYLKPLDDTYGDGNKDAVLRFQKDEKLNPDSIAGDDTKKRIAQRIKDVETRLKELGFYKGEIDGITGDGLENAVKAFQKSVGLPDDGIRGINTATAMANAKTPSKPVESTQPVVTPPATVIAPTTRPKGYLLGIDVAWPQTQKFDLNKIKENRDFIAIKVAGAEDPAPHQIYGPAQMAEKHINMARQIGKPIVFYFFNNGTVNVKAQADKLIEMFKQYGKVGDAVALDVEPSGAATQFTPDQTLEFINYVEEALGIKTAIYMNRDAMEHNDWTKIAEAGHPLWLAAWVGIDKIDTVSTKYWKNWSMIQYNVDKGIYGYPGDIDVDVAQDSFFRNYGFKAYPTSPVEPSEPVVTPGDTSSSDDELKALIKQLIKLLESK